MITISNNSIILQVPRLEAAVDKMGLKYKWKDFTLTDNSCKLQKDTPLALREKFAEKVLVSEEEQLVTQLTKLRSAVVNEVIKDEKGAEKSIVSLEKELEKFEKEVQNILLEDENIIEKDIKGLFGFGKKN